MFAEHVPLGSIAQSKRVCRLYNLPKASPLIISDLIRKRNRLPTFHIIFRSSPYSESLYWTFVAAHMFGRGEDSVLF